ncbi:inhibin alpha chain [Sphaeramia orbicularis]|nr:inhibin alpha chain [Sphaeramia orbicularis]
MVSSTVFVLGPLWVFTLAEACCPEETPREEVVSWFKERILDGLGLEEPPAATVRGPDEDTRKPSRRPPKRSRTTWVNEDIHLKHDTPEIIVFPSSDSSCSTSDSGETTRGPFTYYFQLSINRQEVQLTSGQLWFFAGQGVTVNSSAPLFMLTSAQQLHLAAETPSQTTSDGWTTYDFEQTSLDSMSEGPFLVQIRCPTCQCHSSEPDKTPFLHLHAEPRGPVRSPRRAPVTIPWSPSAVDLLQRPSQEQHSDCHREAIVISFDELGWDSWIVDPKSLTFYYCQGNCSAWDRTTASLGITQCCAPVPGSMRSLRIITTSDGGYSFKYEILPNIIPEECTCF